MPWAEGCLLMQGILVYRKWPVQPESVITVVGGIVVLDASVLIELIGGELVHRRFSGSNKAFVTVSASHSQHRDVP
jgi:hypothetical protein